MAPVGMPMFASGHVDHQLMICSRSVVAALSPLYGRGCLPALVPHAFVAAAAGAVGPWVVQRKDGDALLCVLERGFEVELRFGYDPA